MSSLCFKFESYPSLLYDIFLKLRPSDYRKASLVCRQWNAIARLDSLVQTMYLRCFHALPHPDSIKEKGWKILTKYKSEQLANIREQRYSLFFFDDPNHSPDSRVTRFEVCGKMNFVEKDSGRNFVVNHFGQLIHEYRSDQRMFDSFENLLAGCFSSKPDMLVTYDASIRRGSFYFLPEKLKFTKLGGRFLSKNTMIAYLTRETEYFEHEIKLCLLTWDKNPEIKVHEVYSCKDSKLSTLLLKHRRPLQLVLWKSVYFVVEGKIYFVDLEEKKPAAVKIYEHSGGISDWCFWNDRIYFISEGKVHVWHVLDKKIKLIIKPRILDKVWFRENFLFEYLSTTKHVVITDMEKGSIVGKWSVALPHVPSKLTYTVDAIEYMRDTFFCLYSGAASLKTIRFFDMRTDDVVNLDNIVYLGTQFGCYERMYVRDGRLFVLLSKGEGVIVDFNKTPPPLE